MNVLRLFPPVLDATGTIAGLIIAFLVFLVIVALSFRLVTQTKAMVVERLGGYHKTLGVGIHFIIPKTLIHKLLLRKITLRCKSILSSSSQLPILSYILMVQNIH
jgi:regulator of protease activity HflC (stomatin/prohibitin superfamily)